MEAAIEERWQARTASNPSIFNGLKFRVAAPYGRRLSVGLTDYRAVVGTNFAGEADRAALCARGTTDHGDARAYMSDALGVGAVVTTTDGHVVLIKRSLTAGEAPGQWDVPGGHPEPTDASIDVDTPEGDDANGRVRAELFASIAKEVVEEIGTPADRLAPPRCFALLKNVTTGGRLSMCFEGGGGGGDVQTPAPPQLTPLYPVPLLCSRI